MSRRLKQGAWLLAAVGLLACVAGCLTEPRVFAHAWLAALTCWIGWPIGSLALIFIHALTGGGWGHAIRAQLVAGVATMPLILVLGLPLAFVLPTLYPWVHPQVAAHLNNRFYLNLPFFYARCIVYAIVWVGLAVRVLQALTRPDGERMLYRLAPPGLIALALTVTFSAIDFTLSMDPRFKSSIYGMLIGCESVLLALSVALMARTLTPGASDPRILRDLGRLLFALLVLWAYLDFMQVLIIWNSDLPEEAGWYLARLQGQWLIVALLIVLCHFVLPFFGLIWPQVQRSRRALGGLAALLAIIEIARAWWIVLPAAGRGVSWVDAAALAAVLGIAAASAFARWRSAATLGPALHA